MKTLSILTIAFTSLISAQLHAEEKKEIQFNQLPSIVQQAVLDQVKTDNIMNVEQIIDEGITKYEIESLTDGVNLDVSFTDNGLILELEESTSFNNLPVAAQKAIKKDYPKIVIQKIESVQLYYYEVEGHVDNEEIEFKVLASGDIEDEMVEENKEQ